MRLTTVVSRTGRATCSEQILSGSSYEQPAQPAKFASVNALIKQPGIIDAPALPPSSVIARSIDPEGWNRPCCFGLPRITPAP
jgi:hypothetical protein